MYVPIAYSFAFYFGWASVAAAVLWLTTARHWPRVAQAATRLAIICFVLAIAAEYARFHVLPRYEALQAVKQSAPWQQPRPSFHDV
jgi:hypothetical protein